jgi:hypothetical protein
MKLTMKKDLMLFQGGLRGFMGVSRGFKGVIYEYSNIHSI